MEGEDSKQVTAVPITFTKDEIWLLSDFCRHEISQMETWKFPPADLELNEEIALALDACETSRIKEYTLLLTKQQLLVIDFYVRKDAHTPEGASGKIILLKVNRARAKLAGMDDPVKEKDIAFKEVKDKYASASNDPSTNADGDAEPIA